MPPEKQEKDGKEFVSTGVMFPFIIAFVLLAFMLVVGRSSCGCIGVSRNTMNVREPDPRYPDLNVTIRNCSDEVLEELDKIAEEGNAPELLFPKEETPETKNLAEVLEQKLGPEAVPVYRQLLPFAQRVSGAYWEVPVDILEKARPIIGKNTKEIQEIRKVLDREDAVFIPHLNMTANYGPQITVDLINALETYPLLEEFEIARFVREENIDGAVDSLIYILRTAELASGFPGTETRLVSANMRERAFSILQSLVWNPQFTEAHARKIYSLLRVTLLFWPSDAKTLIGERIASLWTYEMARVDALSQTLAPDEMQRLRSLGNFDSLLLNLKSTVDEDQMFYFQSIRSLIDASQTPFFTRDDVFDKIDKDIASKLNKPDYPLVASILLYQLNVAMKNLALDLARTETWTCALGKSFGELVDDIYKDPVIGEEYEIKYTPGSRNPDRLAVSVSRPSENTTIDVPVFRTPQKSE